jgi:hypothetical protein
MEPDYITERFVDYLFDLYEGKIPKIVKLMIERQEDDVLYLQGMSDVKKTAAYLRGKPFDCNMPCLGMTLFGMSWPFILKDVDKMIKKRWKKEAIKNGAR